LLLQTIVLMVAPYASAGQPDAAIPQKLALWADLAYPERIFIVVEAPGEAGNVELHRDVSAAGLRLPLRMVPPVGNPIASPVPEQILLLGEDGIPQPVNVRQTPGDSDVEIRFRTQPGLRRFCLYYGAAANSHPRVSSTDFMPPDFGLSMRGCSAPGDFQYLPDKPLTLDRFRILEKSAASSYGARTPATLDEPECPYVNVTVDGLGHNPQKVNPERYAALYEGFLRTPIKGTYAFALDTPGATHVLIDGKPVIIADSPDVNRAVFALQSSTELNEGVHRVVVYYAEANPAGKTNAELQRFGLRLHWKPPWSKAFMCIPPDSFLHALPVQIIRHEMASGPVQNAKDGGGMTAPFIQTEVLAHIRCAAHLGDSAVHEKVLLFVRPIDAGDAETLSLAIGKEVVLNEPIARAAEGGGWFKWVPAGKEITASLLTSKSPESLAHRSIEAYASKDGRGGVLDVQGELELKNAPDFLYPDEVAHIHAQTGLSVPPRIVPKERSEANLLPAIARPMGEYRLTWNILSDKLDAPMPVLRAGEELEATPFENGRHALRVSIPGSALDTISKDGHARIVLALTIGDVECESITLRLLNAEKEWPGEVIAGPGNLFFTTGIVGGTPHAPHAPSEGLQDKSGTKLSSWQLERVLMLLHRQDDSEYRNFAVLKSAALISLGDTALFLGDPLVEGSPGGAAQATPLGLASLLAKATSKLKWEQIYIAGPHRDLPVYRLLAELETYLHSKEKVPALVVLSLGAGDVARQTPLYCFERALDALLDRLKEKGAKKIVIVGVIPEVDREAHAEPYQQKVLDLQRQHHLTGIDVFHAWTRENNWTRRYSVDKEQLSVFGPLPNADALEEISKMIEEQIR
jgi:hypothetical protein